MDVGAGIDCIAGIDIRPYAGDWTNYRMKVMTMEA